MKLSELKQGQIIEVRHGRAGEIEPNWGPWHNAKIDYLVRREQPLPKSMQQRSNAPNAGDVLTLAIEGWPCEYGQGDYCGDGTFLAEDWYLEIKGLE